MDKAWIAEWILTCVCTKQRASEITGDLLEQETRPTINFWLAIMRVVFAISWRWMVGYVFAVTSLWWALIPSQHFIVPKAQEHLDQTRRAWLANGHRVPLSAGDWTHSAAVLMGLSVLLWSVAALAISRYGVRDERGRAGALLASLLTLCSCLAWMRYAEYVIPAVVCGTVVALLLNAGYRRAVLCLVFASMAVAFIFLSTAFTIERYSHLGSFYSAIIIGAAWFASPLAGAWILAHTNYESRFAPANDW